MLKDLKLRALYYPYSRCTSIDTLKRATILFDEIGFIDPVEDAAREGLMVNDFYMTSPKIVHQWKKTREQYYSLREEGIVKIYNPRPIISKYDKLLAKSFHSDAEDGEFVETCRHLSEITGTRRWNILKERIPPSLGGYISEWSYRFPRGVSGQWSGPWYFPNEDSWWTQFCGSSLNLNQALIVSEENNLVLFTDNKIHNKLLQLKYQRAITNPDADIQEVLLEKTPAYFQKFNILAINIVNTLIPAKELERRSISDILQYKKRCAESLDRFRRHILELTAQIESEVWDEKFYKEVAKIIDSKIVPEALQLQDQMKTVYEKLFGAVLKKIAISLTPTLFGTIFTGLSNGQILTLSCTALSAALGLAVPELIETWQSKKALSRNSLAYLLDFGSATTAAILPTWQRTVNHLSPSELQKKSVEDHLLDKLDIDDSFVQTNIIAELGKLRAKKATKPLLEKLNTILEDKGGNYKEQAAKYELLKSIMHSLGHISDKDAVEPLLAIMRSNPSSSARAVAANALRRILDADFIQYLEEALRDDDIRLPVIETLYDLRDERVLDFLIQLLKDPQFYVRGAALRQLMGLGRNYGASETIKTNALEAWARIGRERVVNVLIEALKDSDQSVRYNAAQALGLLKSKEAVEPLIQALLDDEEMVRVTVIEALGRIGDSKAVEPLIRALDDSIAYVRRDAAVALGNFGDKRAIRYLMQKSEDNAEEVKAAVKQALKKLQE